MRFHVSVAVFFFQNKEEAILVVQTIALCPANHAAIVCFNTDGESSGRCYSRGQMPHARACVFWDEEGGVGVRSTWGRRDVGCLGEAGCSFPDQGQAGRSTGAFSGAVLVLSEEGGRNPFLTETLFLLSPFPPQRPLFLGSSIKIKQITNPA